jgi:hypothetical protein
MSASISRIGMAALAALLLAASAGGARALTLDDLAGGASFATGPLTFSDFEVIVTGDLSLDLAAYPVQVLADGFRLSGPLSVLLGDAGTVLLSYVVTATDPIGVGASLLAPGSAIGDGSQAWVGETLLDAASQPLGALFAYTVVGVGSDTFEQTSFAAVSTVQVAKTLHVGSGLFAALPLVEQRFLVVPEPLTLVLLTLGISGLAFWGRRHGSPVSAGRRRPA